MEQTVAPFSLSSNPFIEPGVALSGKNEAGARFGWRVAVSADGNTALVTSPSGVSANDAWVFTRSGSTWTQQGPRLQAPYPPSSFGFSSALSADGDTALIGSVGNTAFVYSREGSTWTDDGELPAAGLSCGFDVALSADGNTALEGCPGEFGGAGTAFVFTRSSGIWSEQAHLFGIYGAGETSEGQFGRAVALSADGNTAIISAPLNNSRTGAAWIFVRSGSTWALQSETLIGSGETDQGLFGERVALSADGNTALIGSSGENGNTGAAWVFARSGSSWVAQGEKLTGNDATGVSQFGFGLALSADGQTALIGGPGDTGNRGAVWTFERSGSNWVQSGPKFVGESAPNDQFGTSVALSTDGNTVLVGAPNNSEQGTVWAYSTSSFPPPTIKKRSPTSGLAAGGTVVTVTGENFVDANSVSFGGEPAESFVVNSPTSITAISPAGTSGTVPISVATPWGSSPAAAKARFKYSAPTITEVAPPSGPVTGGTNVTLVGTGFATGASTEISFGKISATGVECSSTTHCVAIAPEAKKGGAVTVTASVGGLKSSKTSSSIYTYE